MDRSRADSDPDVVPPPDASVVVVGQTLGAVVARRLSSGAGSVTLLTDDDRAASRAGGTVDVVGRTPTDPAALRETAATADIVVIAAGDDGRNLLLSRLAVLEGGPAVFTLVEDPENVQPFRDADVTPVCVSEAVAETLTERVGTSR